MSSSIKNNTIFYENKYLTREINELKKENDILRENIVSLVLDAKKDLKENLSLHGEIRYGIDRVLNAEALAKAQHLEIISLKEEICVDTEALVKAQQLEIISLKEEICDIVKDAEYDQILLLLKVNLLQKELEIKRKELENALITPSHI
jgi:hypothetical protein